MKASDGKVVHVYAMYCMLAKGALLGPPNPSEMGPMRGFKSLAFWGRGGGGEGGAKSLLYTGSQLDHGENKAYSLVLLKKPSVFIAIAMKTSYKCIRVCVFTYICRRV